MDIQELLSKAQDTISVKRVFGEPYEKDGVTLIPVATVAGGGGGGSGEDEDESGHKGRSKGGFGFGMHARPAGVYVIKGDSVTWTPALDLNRVIMGGQIVAVLALIVLRPLFKAKARAAELAAKRAAEGQS